MFSLTTKVTGCLCLFISSSDTDMCSECDPYHNQNLTTCALQDIKRGMVAVLKYFTAQAEEQLQHLVGQNLM